MNRKSRAAAALTAALAVTALGLAPAAQAAKPEITVIDIDNVFSDEFLTEACGVAVTTTATGTVRIATFSGDQPLQEIVTINVALVARAGDNVIRLRNVGSDQTLVRPDGTVVVSIRGQVPLNFRGVLKFDADTGEVLHEPTASGGDLERVCDALTA